MKQKDEESKIVNSQDVKVYTPSAFMAPHAFVSVKDDDASGIQTHVHDFIMSIPDGVQELFIPIFSSSVSHWTLLHLS
ncbi:hypothetical protein MKW98_019586 [Papaver atlanticum]|uniref:Uncharacterized protein n=1 Tax=Papaver atlanticum TaxID=357466 RepID=A0AAD4S8L7_9MAGN|nr:hypothetical protein MKW98_019586 [Papaver atlanticum]